MAKVIRVFLPRFKSYPSEKFRREIRRQLFQLSTRPDTDTQTDRVKDSTTSSALYMRQFYPCQVDYSVYIYPVA